MFTKIASSVPLSGVMVSTIYFLAHAHLAFRPRFELASFMQLSTSSTGYKEQTAICVNITFFGETTPVQKLLPFHTDDVAPRGAI